MKPPKFTQLYPEASYDDLQHSSIVTLEPHLANWATVHAFFQTKKATSENLRLLLTMEANRPLLTEDKLPPRQPIMARLMGRLAKLEAQRLHKLLRMEGKK